MFDFLFFVWSVKRPPEIPVESLTTISPRASHFRSKWDVRWNFILINLFMKRWNGFTFIFIESQVQSIYQGLWFFFIHEAFGAFAWTVPRLQLQKEPLRKIVYERETVASRTTEWQQTVVPCFFLSAAPATKSTQSSLVVLLLFAPHMKNGKKQIHTLTL